MSFITADELQLLRFFEVEPARLDKDVTWPYNEFSYQVTRGGLTLSFSVAPAYKDVRITLKQENSTLYELHGVSVEDVMYHNDKGKEVIEIVINEEDKLFLSVKPWITITHVIRQDT